MAFDHNSKNSMVRFSALLKYALNHQMLPSMIFQRIPVTTIDHQIRR